ncbi:cell division cycle-associated protein 7-like isoform X2 [Panicum virgatum]|uniref:cell division cycle-associated protein 7-like isoform X2 n=1 Tax=Panicum virgatum TaxID=38727 RepID=UPI0019D674CF|nr:cell division cycle-associated protein 7-like isoform X2 [Panicum virgatum]
MATGGVPAAGPSPAPAEAPGSPVSPLEAAGADYERVRAARIRENMERMRKLGILDLAHNLTSSSLAAAAGGGTGRGRARQKPVEPGSPGAPPPKPKLARRSLRLKNVEPVSYCEIQPKKERDPQGVRTELLEEGAKEEIYTEEHEKLLGTCNTPWTLFVDGCDKDGKRIYDQVRGQTCHQCRQKTLGHHTSCCKCQIVQGQFCGDCLYMRYGENVLEAKKNPSWICPVCRGICNCSICRTKKGWFPTGSAYRKVVRLGYNSVAHYLIATQRASANPEDSSSADFSNKQLPDKSETSCVSDHDATAAKESLEDGETSSKAKQSKANCRQVKNSDGDKDDSRSESAVTSDAHIDQANNNVGCVTPSSKPTSRKRKYERSPDCIARRLRSRSNKP